MIDCDKAFFPHSILEKHINKSILRYINVMVKIWYYLFELSIVWTNFHSAHKDEFYCLGLHGGISLIYISSYYY